MRLLILQDHLRRGGTERQSLFAAQTARKAGHEVLLLVHRPGGELTQEAVNKQIPIKNLQPFNSCIDEWSPGLERAIRSFNPDKLLAMGKVANLNTARVRKSFPDLSIINSLRTGKDLSEKLKAIYRKSGNIIVNSRDASQRLQALGIPESRIRLLYNACLAQRNHALQEPISPPFHLVCLAMLRPEKNHTELLEILAQLPPKPYWECTIAGSGNCLDSLEKQALKLGIADRIDFAGTVHNINSLLASAHLCLSTSQRESLPNALIEAQAHGVPVAAYDVNGVKETFIDGSSGSLIPNGDQSAMVNAIHSLLNNKEKRLSYRQAAKEFAREQFNPDIQAQRFLQIMETA